jgi:phosphoglycolate phosphatase
MEETGAAPDQTVMIGDTSYDMQMAANAGVAAIGVDWGYHTAEELLEAGAGDVARDFPHLARLLSDSKATAAA